VLSGDIVNASAQAMPSTEKVTVPANPDCHGRKRFMALPPIVVEMAWVNQHGASCNLYVAHRSSGSHIP
jgi:hypothetical protein